MPVGLARKRDFRVKKRGERERERERGRSGKGLQRQGKRRTRTADGHVSAKGAQSETKVEAHEPERGRQGGRWVSEG